MLGSRSNLLKIEQVNKRGQKAGVYLLFLRPVLSYSPQLLHNLNNSMHCVKSKAMLPVAFFPLCLFVFCCCLYGKCEPSNEVLDGKDEPSSSAYWVASANSISVFNLCVLYYLWMLWAMCMWALCKLQALCSVCEYETNNRNTNLKCEAEYKWV